MHHRAQLLTWFSSVVLRPEVRNLFLNHAALAGHILGLDFAKSKGEGGAYRCPECISVLLTRSGSNFPRVLCNKIAYTSWTREWRGQEKSCTELHPCICELEAFMFPDHTEMGKHEGAWACA